jgi:hemoglobin
MKKDIKNRNDIELLVNTFYERINAEKSIAYIFNEVAHVNWEIHLPHMYDFFENILFYTGKYEGNPYSIHHQLSKNTSIDKKHFNKWIKIFNSTVDELFEGEKAALLKQKILNIAINMQKKK